MKIKSSILWCVQVRGPCLTYWGDVPKPLPGLFSLRAETCENRARMRMAEPWQDKIANVHIYSL